MLSADHQSYYFVSAGRELGYIFSLPRDNAGNLIDYTKIEVSIQTARSARFKRAEENKIEANHSLGAQGIVLRAKNNANYQIYEMRHVIVFYDENGAILDACSNIFSDIPAQSTATKTVYASNNYSYYGELDRYEVYFIYAIAS